LNSNLQPRILIVKLGALGDLYFAKPSIETLIQVYPGAKIDWLVDENLTSVLKSEKRIHQIFTTSLKILIRGSLFERIQEIWRLRMALPRYDGILLLHRSLAYGSFLWGKGPLVSLHRSWDFSFFHWTFVKSPILARHESLILKEAVEEGLHLLKKRGFLVASPIQPDAWLPEPIPWNKNQSIAIHLGGGQNQGNQFDLKQWSHWERLTQLILEKTQAKIVFIGNSLDQGSAEKIIIKLPESQLFRVLNLVGQIPVSELPQKLSECQVFVGVDSGPLHIADYLGLPAIGLFGPTSEISWGALRTSTQILKSSFPCQPCYQDDGYFPPCGFSHRCMVQLTPEIVFASLLHLLKT
jgi:ADP-heptose:LPS heptosyltransferase